MDIFNLNALYLFIIFFIPGFISIKIYDLLIPGEKRDFSSSISEVIAYSCLNYAFLSWLIVLITKNNYYINHTSWFILFVFLILFFAPILWPILFLRIISNELISKYVVNPVPRPWDFIFSKRESYWIIVNLKSGLKIGGLYDTNSYTSSYPIKEQIYLEEVWKLDENGAFKTPIDRSNGILILGDEISSIEFFK